MDSIVITPNVGPFRASPEATRRAQPRLAQDV